VSRHVGLRVQLRSDELQDAGGGLPVGAAPVRDIAIQFQDGDGGGGQSRLRRMQIPAEPAPAPLDVDLGQGFVESRARCSQSSRRVFRSVLGFRRLDHSPEQTAVRIGGQAEPAVRQLRQQEKKENGGGSDGEHPCRDAKPGQPFHGSHEYQKGGL